MDQSASACRSGVHVVASHQGRKAKATSGLSPTHLLPLRAPNRRSGKRFSQAGRQACRHGHVARFATLPVSFFGIGIRLRTALTTADCRTFAENQTTARYSTNSPKIHSGIIERKLFPAEDDAHPGLTLFKVVIMTLVLLTAGVAIYRSSRRAQQPDIAPR